MKISELYDHKIKYDSVKYLIKSIRKVYLILITRYFNLLYFLGRICCKRKNVQIIES